MFKAAQICALAAATASGTALAVSPNVDLYGDFRISGVIVDADSPVRDRGIDNNNSHVGLRISARTGSTVTPFLVYERLLDNDSNTGLNEATRQFFAGVKTDYGTAIFGRAPTAYKLTGQKLDPFYNTSVAGFTGGVAGTSLLINGASHGLSALANDTPGSGFIGNQLAYSAPTFMNVTVNAAYFINESADGGADDFGLGAEYAFNGITAGVQALAIRSGTGQNGTQLQNFSAIGLGLNAGQTAEQGEVNTVRYYGAYATKTWGVGGSLEVLDLKGGLEDRDYAIVSGWYGLTDKIRLAALFGDTQGTPFEGRSYTVGASYEVAPDFTAYVAARQFDRGNGGNFANFPGDVTMAAAGISYKFDISLR